MVLLLPKAGIIRAGGSFEGRAAKRGSRGVQNATDVREITTALAHFIGLL